MQTLMHFTSHAMLTTVTWLHVKLVQCVGFVAAWVVFLIPLHRFFRKFFLVIGGSLWNYFLINTSIVDWYLETCSELLPVSTPFSTCRRCFPASMVIRSLYWKCPLLNLNTDYSAMSQCVSFSYSICISHCLARCTSYDLLRFLCRTFIELPSLSRVITSHFYRRAVLAGWITVTEINRELSQLVMVIATL